MAASGDDLPENGLRSRGGTLSDNIYVTEPSAFSATAALRSPVLVCHVLGRAQVQYEGRKQGMARRSRHKRVGDGLAKWRRKLWGKGGGRGGGGLSRDVFMMAFWSASDRRRTHVALAQEPMSRLERPRLGASVCSGEGAV